MVSKFCLIILVRNPELRKAEVPFEFGERFSGESKASAAEVWKYLNLLWTLRFGNGLMRFVGFALVGLSGVFVNSLALFIVTDQLKIFYLYSTVFATITSTLWNFIFTETLVYKSERRSNRFYLSPGDVSSDEHPCLSTSYPNYLSPHRNDWVCSIYSNLVSLAVLSILRFMLAENFIWTKSNPISDPLNAGSKEGVYPMKKNYSYNIHNIVTVVSEGKLPELEPFRRTERSFTPHHYD